MAQPVLLETEIEVDPKAIAAFDERPRPRPVAARPLTRTPRYPGAVASSTWQRYSDWWAWGAALFALATLVAVIAWG